MSNLPQIQIFPESGYRNSTFAFRTFGLGENTTFKIRKDGQLYSTNQLDQRSVALYLRVDEPGHYEVIAQDDAGSTARNEFKVQDAVQIGSGVVRSTYLYSEAGKVIIVKKDRMLIYDTHTHEELIINSVSPSNILQINSQLVLLETQISRDHQLFNFGLFDLSTLTIIQEWEGLRKIRFDEHQQRLWVYHPEANYTAAIALSQGGNPENMLLKIDGKPIVNQNGTDFLLVDSLTLTLVDIKNACVKQIIEKQDALAISLSECLMLTNRQGKLEIKNFFSTITPIVTLPEHYLIDLNLDWVGSGFQKEAHNGLSEASLITQARNVALQKVMDHTVQAGERLNFTYEPAVNCSIARTLYRFYHIGQNVYRVNTVNTTHFTGLVTATKSLYYTDPEQVLMNFQIESTTSQRITVNHHKGLTFSFYEQLTIDKLKLYRSPDQQKGIFWLSGEGYSLYVACDGQQSAELTDLAAGAEPELLHITGLGYYVLRNVSGGCTELYKLELNRLRLLVDVEAKLFHRDYLESHQLLWLQNTTASPNTYYQVYDLISERLLKLEKNIPGSALNEPGGQYQVNTQGHFERDYFVTEEKVLVRLQPFEIKSAVAGKVIGYSANLDLVLTYTDENGYHLFQYHQEQQRYLAVKIADPDLHVTEAQLLPNGRFALLRTAGKGELQVYDIAQQQMISYITGKFLGFTNEGSIIMETTMHQTVKVFDPDTFQDITPAQYHFYRHLSPDGKLFSQRSKTWGYYHFPEKRVLSQTEYRSFESQFEREEREDLTTFERRYQALLDASLRNYPGYFRGTGRRFRHHREIAGDVAFIEIGISGTDITADLPAVRLRYYNYLAFSPDNRFAGIVGKPDGTGLFQLFQIDFDEQANTLKVIDWVTHDEPSLATWICAFSEGNYFGTYDSGPNTFLVNVTDELFSQKFEENNIRRHTRRLEGKSFECFSPHGTFLALSEKGYEPISLGGRGHIDSKDLYIAQTDSGKITRHFREHGDYVTFAAFSADGKRLLSASKDGVVIIRDIEL